MYTYTADQLKEFSIIMPIFVDDYFEFSISENPFIRVGIAQRNNFGQWSLNGYLYYYNDFSFALRGFFPKNITALYGRSGKDLMSVNFIDIHLSNFKEEVENTFNRLKKLTVFK